MKNKTGLPTGTYVKRSTYQKVCEENKRLKADIYMLVEKPTTLEGISVFAKWRSTFKNDREFVWLMKEAAKAYLKEHPELDIMKTPTTNSLINH